MPMYNLAFSTAFQPRLHCMFTFPSFRFHKLTVFVELVTVISSWDTFNISIGSSVVPIRVPRVRIDLATLSSNGCKG